MRLKVVTPETQEMVRRGNRCKSLPKRPRASGRPAPGLGQRTAEVLGEAGYSSGEIERLRGVGAVT